MAARARDAVLCLATLGLLRALGAAACPPKCSCGDSGRQVYCSDLNSIPRDLPASALSLFISYSQLSAVDLSAFPPLPELLNLTLRNCHIERLDMAGPSAVPGVRRLDLSQNSLETFSEDVVRGLPNLTELDLSSNDFRAFPVEVGRGAAQLEELFLDYNELEMIDGGDLALPRLTTLGLSGNAIRQLSDDAISALPSLSVLWLGANFLTAIPSRLFNGASQLQRLVLQANQIETIPASAFQGLSGLVYLDLSSLSVTTLVSGTFAGLTSLKELVIGNSKLLSLDGDAWHGLGALTSLDLESAPFPYLGDDWFAGLASLESLSLYSHQLTSIAVGAFRGLASLKTLDLRPLTFQKTLARLSPGVFDPLESLEYLQLDHNAVTLVEAGTFTRQSRLSELSLRENRITAIAPGAFAGLSSLHLLDLKINRITAIAPGAFAGLSSLQLDLTSNEITAIAAGAFNHSSSLKLDLSSNRIAEIVAGAFAGLSSVQLLDLSRNPVREVDPTAFDPLGGTLTALDLGAWGVPTFPPGFLDSLTPRTQVNLAFNFLDCCSDAAAYLVNLQNMNVTGRDTLVCYTPFDAGGVRVDQLRERVVLDCQSDPTQSRATLCDIECVGGCSGAEPDLCFGCKHSKEGRACVSACSPAFWADNTTNHLCTACNGSCLYGCDEDSLRDYVVPLDLHLRCDLPAPPGASACDPECIGGCSAPGPTNCLACRNLNDNGTCVADCPAQMWGDQRTNFTCVDCGGRCLYSCDPSVPGFSAPLSTVQRCALHPPGLNTTCDAECDGGCFDTGADHCLECQRMQLANGTCVAHCPDEVPLHTLNGRVCNVTCPDEAPYIDAGALCVAHCKAGEGPNEGNECVPCDPECAGECFASGPSNCRSCRTNRLNDTCMAECPPEWWSSEGSCLTCGGHCLYACNPKDPGFSAPPEAHLRCTLPPPGVNASCSEQCDNGCYAAGADHCRACRRAAYNGTCVGECPSQAPYVADKQCLVRCPSDLPYAEEGNACVPQCGAGRRPDRGGKCVAVKASAAVPPVALLGLATLLVAACVAVWHVRRKQRRTAGAIQRLRIQSEFVHEDEWEYPRSELKKVKPIAAGYFGEVWLYEARDIDAHAASAWRLQHCGRSLYGAVWVACKLSRWWMQWTTKRRKRPVAVKTLKAGSAGEESTAASLTTEELLHFRQEATIMKRLRHPHIVNLLAESIAETPAMIIMEYCEEGSLLDRLQTSAASDPPIALATRVRYCADIASAMAYIHDHGIIHRDLAARNCLLTQGEVKVSDFGLSRLALLSVGGGGGADVGGSEHFYQMRQDSTKLPVRWMAPEVLESLRFTQAGDVWSFGVTAWEVFTDGRTPYDEIQDSITIPSLVKRGLIRLEAPKDEVCPKHIWDFIEQCLAIDAAERPTFVELDKLWAQASSEREPHGGEEDDDEEAAPFHNDADPAFELKSLAKTPDHRSTGGEDWAVFDNRLAELREGDE